MFNKNVLNYKKCEEPLTGERETQAQTAFTLISITKHLTT